MFSFLASESLATALLNGLLLGLVLTAVVWGVLRVAPRLNAATRYAVLGLTLAAVVALPAVYGTLAFQRHHASVEVVHLSPTIHEHETTFVLRDGHLIDLQRVLEERDRVLALQQRALEAVEMDVMIDAELRALEELSEQLERESALLERDTKRLEKQVIEYKKRVAPAEEAEAVSVVVTPAAPRAPIGEAALIALPAGWLGGGWLPFAAAAWAVIALFLMARVGRGVLRLQQLKAGSMKPEAPLQARFEKHVRALGIRRDVRLAVSDDVAVPLVAGLTQPYVLLPSALVAQLSGEEFNQVVLHELAHVQRWDDWAKLAQKCTEALFFFHPAVHVLAAAIDREREIACDDQVVRHAKGSRKAYASCLARLVELTRWPSAHTLAPGAGSSKEELFDRVRNVLDGSRDTSDRLSRRGLLVAVTGVTAVFVFAAHVSLVTAQVAPPPTPPAPPPAPAPVAAVAPVAPAVPAAPVDAVPPAQDVPLFVMWMQDGITYNVESEGTLSLTSDSRDVTAIEEGGRLTLKAEGEGILRRIEVHANNDNLEYRYWRDGQRTAFTKEIHRWFSNTLHRAVQQQETLLAQGAALETRTAQLRTPVSNFIEDIHDERWESSWTEDGVKYKVSARGEITFGDDDRSIAAIERNGSFRLTVEGRGMDRRVDVLPSRSGLEYRYWSGGRRAEFDAGARRWFGDTVLRVIRHSGIDAEARAKRILRQGGTAALLREIDEIGTDYGKRRYMTAAVEHANLNDGEIARLIKLAGEMGSDYEKRQVLHAIATEHRLTAGTRDAFFDVLAEMSSDYEKRQVLTALVERNPDAATRRAAIAQAQDMGSDYEKRQVLQHAIKRGDDDAMKLDFLKASLTIGSDYEKRQVLTQVLQDDATSPALLRLALQGTRDLDSDYEKRQVLEQIAQRMSNDPAMYRTYLDLVATLDSDYEKRQVLHQLLQHNQLDRDALTQTLTLAAGINSDYEKRQVLTPILQRYTAEDYLRPAFFRIVRSMGSDYEQRQLLTQVFEADRLPDAALVDALNIVAEMDSDYERAQLLIHAAPHLADANDRVIDAFVEVVEDIDSDHEYNKVVAAVSRERGLRSLLRR